MQLTLCLGIERKNRMRPGPEEGRRRDWLAYFRLCNSSTNSPQIIVIIEVRCNNSGTKYFENWVRSLVLSLVVSWVLFSFVRSSDLRCASTSQPLVLSRLWLLSSAPFTAVELLAKSSKATGGVRKTREWVRRNSQEEKSNSIRIISILISPSSCSSLASSHVSRVREQDYF